MKINLMNWTFLLLLIVSGQALSEEQNEQLNNLWEKADAKTEFTECISSRITHHNSNHINLKRPIDQKRLLKIPKGWKVVGANGHSDISVIILCR